MNWSSRSLGGPPGSPGILKAYQTNPLLRPKILNYPYAFCASLRLIEYYQFFTTLFDSSTFPPLLFVKTGLSISTLCRYSLFSAAGTLGLTFCNAFPSSVSVKVIVDKKVSKMCFASYILIWAYLLLCLCNLF